MVQDKCNKSKMISLRIRLVSSNLGEKIETIFIPLLPSRQTGQTSERRSLRISSINISADGKLTIRFSRPIFKAKIESILQSDNNKRLLGSNNNTIEQVL